MYQAIIQAVLMAASLNASPSAKLAAPGSYDYAMAQASRCAAPTSWASQVMPGVWYGMCGDAEGNELYPASSVRAEPADERLLPGYGAGRTLAPEGAVDENADCNRTAELHWHVAAAAQLDADSHYENAYARCLEAE